VAAQAGFAVGPCDGIPDCADRPATEFLTLIEKLADKIKHVGIVGEFQARFSRAAKASPRSAQVVRAAGRSVHTDEATAAPREGLGRSHFFAGRRDWSRRHVDLC